MSDQEVKQTWPKTVTLPFSGATAVIRRGTGRDISLGGQAVDVGKDGVMRLQVSILARKISVNGKPLTLEDLESMDEEDVWFLMAESGQKKLSPPSTSQP